MSKKKAVKTQLSFFLILIMMFDLTACGLSRKPAPESSIVAGDMTGEASTEESGALSSEVSEAEEASDNPQTELSGAPWTSSILTGTLPEQAPEAKDDLYLHYNYDKLAAHQGEYYMLIAKNQTTIQEYLNEFMKAGKLTGDENGSYTETELEQLSIFYQQAYDLETLSKTGMSELQPYLDRIKNAASLAKLNEVLADKDFPFSPFLYLTVSSADMTGVENVGVNPEFLFADNFDGALLYQEPANDDVRNAQLQKMGDDMLMAAGDLMLLGYSYEEAVEKVFELFDFEKSYGKDAFYTYRYQNKEYGALAKSYEQISLDELVELCPAYPVKETIVNNGKGAAACYLVSEKKWLSTFSSVWKEENLEILKIMAMVKIIHECEPYLDPALFNDVYELAELEPKEASQNAAAACDQNLTFAHLVAKIYVADHYTEEDISRLSDLSKDLIKVFKGLVEASSWIEESSRKEINKKLDEMRLCILSPEGGYLDFSDLNLIKSEDGGTLFSNYLRLKKWVNEKMNARIGKPAMARLAWEVYPPDTINCFYHSDANSINILPGYTAAGVYRSDMSKEELLAKMGWTIGHEISHGFDYIGSQIDAYGRFICIFDEKSLETYLEKVGRVEAYYDSIEVLPGVYCEGKSLNAEAVADLIGMELVMEVAKEDSSFDYKVFYENMADLYLQVLPSMVYFNLYLLIDSHPLSFLRVNVNAQMFDEFYDTYDVKKGDAMYLKKEERIHFFGNN